MGLPRYIVALVSDIIADIDKLVAMLRNGQPSRIYVARKVRALRERIRDADDLSDDVKVKCITRLAELIKTIFPIGGI